MVFLLALLAVIAPLVVVQPLQDDVALGKLVTTAVFTGAALLWGAVLLARERWPAGRWPLTLWLPVAVFVLVNVLAWSVALDWRHSLLGGHQRYQGLATTLLYVLLFAAAATAVRTLRDLRILLLGLFAGALAAAIYALIQQAGLDWVDWRGRSIDRPFATLGQANLLGAFLVASISAGSALALTAGERWQQAAFGLGLLTMLCALLFTVSQSAYVAATAVWLVWGVALQYLLFRPGAAAGLRLALSVLVVLAFGAPLLFAPAAIFFVNLSPPQAAVFVIAGVVLLLVGLAFVRYTVPALEEAQVRSMLRVGLGLASVAPFIVGAAVIFLVGLPGRESVTEALDSEAIGGRLSLWRLGIEMTADRPALGFGQDAYPLLFARYRDEPDLPGIGTRAIAPESAHNFFLDLSAGTGVLGLLAFLALVVAVLFHAVRRITTAEDASLRVALVALSGAVLGYLAAVFFGFAESITSWAFWLLLGALAGLLLPVQPRPVEAAPESARLPGTGALASGMLAIALALLGVLLVGWAASLTAADLAAAQADAALQRQDYPTAVRLAGRAANLNPLQKRYLLQQARTYEQAAPRAVDEVQARERVVELYERARRRFEPDATTMANLALARERLAELEGVALEDLEALLDGALALDPYNGPLRLFIADVCEGKGLDACAYKHRLTVLTWRGQR